MGNKRNGLRWKNWLRLPLYGYQIRVILNLDKVRLYRPIPQWADGGRAGKRRSVYISRKYLKEVRDRFWRKRNEV